MFIVPIRNNYPIYAYLYGNFCDKKGNQILSYYEWPKQIEIYLDKQVYCVYCNSKQTDAVIRDFHPKRNTKM